MIKRILALSILVVMLGYVYGYVNDVEQKFEKIDFSQTEVWGQRWYDGKKWDGECLTPLEFHGVFEELYPRTFDDLRNLSREKGISVLVVKQQFEEYYGTELSRWLTDVLNRMGNEVLCPEYLPFHVPYLEN